MLNTESKQAIVEKYKRKDGDTGSPEVQVALLTHRVQELTAHMQTHTKDHHSRRGLLLLVSQRRALLDYLKRKDSGSYQELITSLGIRR